ncbi:hypothetical protein AXG93_4874s1130 [Marchantia polymorpha subsp. ruderalis]|uniref:Cyclin N-terminal domain-containing protein n=1 Tax=Marchantia polymorpha subsp. ruderalis TaxID=1480154 RepID=A0A176WEW3_MARPO|nr:hypothetical protein AXG93_4874s1130 [Marchantia polymorpha subsp. ruderalis]
MAGTRVERAERPAGRENMATKGGLANAPPAANTRRALGDIGNLVGAMAVRCHVSKDGVVNPVKQEVVTTWGAKQRRTAVVVTAEVKAEPVVEESKVLDAASASASAVEADIAPAAGLPPTGPRLKAFATRGQRTAAVKKVPTLTATLTARSEALGRHDTEMLEADEQVPNIDEADIGNQLAVVDYVEDIYSFYRKAEVQSCVAPDYMTRQADINDKMRAILIDWLIEVHLKFGLMPETLFLTTNLIDRYLSTESVSRKTLQLVGVTAMLLAAKYEEIIAPEVEAIVFISDDAYTRQQVLAMEKAMLNTLRFNLTVPTPYVFMVRFLKAAVSDKQMELLAFFLVELCLTEYSMVKFPPSQLAAAAVYTAHHTLGRTPCWTPSLVRHSGYAEAQLKDCSNMMVGFHRKAAEGKLLVVHKKYSSSKFQSVATLAPAVISADGELESPASNA